MLSEEKEREMGRLSFNIYSLFVANSSGYLNVPFNSYKWGPDSNFTKKYIFIKILLFSIFSIYIALLCV